MVKKSSWLLWVILGLGILGCVTYLFASPEARIVLEERTKAVLTAYCSTITPEARHGMIAEIREDLPWWPEEGICSYMEEEVVAPK